MTATNIEPAAKAQDFAYDSKNPTEEDIENGSGDMEYSTFVVDKAVERKLLWKFDIHILPMLAIMYLFK
jgi:hypothetical protein